MGVTATQRDATNNQSTVDFVRENLFIFGNRYQDGIFVNNTGAEATFKAGSLVLRDTTTANQIKPAVAGATLTDVIGILAIDGTTVLADAATIENASYCVKGDIDASLLEFPDGVTLDTVPTGSAKNLRDILTDLGFVLFNVVENSKTAN